MKIEGVYTLDQLRSVVEVVFKENFQNCEFVCVVNDEYVVVDTQNVRMTFYETERFKFGHVESSLYVKCCTVDGKEKFGLDWCCRNHNIEYSIPFERIPIDIEKYLMDRVRYDIGMLASLLGDIVC